MPETLLNPDLTAPDSGLPLAAPDLSLIVPFRCDDPERLENLRTVLRYMARMLAGAEIVLIEDSARPVAGGLGAIEGLRYAAAVHDGPFHRTRLLNHGLLTLATRPLVAAWDADVIAYPQAMAGALNRLRAGAEMVFAHDGRFMDLSGGLRARLVAQGGAGDLPLPPFPARPSWWQWRRTELTCHNVASVGGAVLFRRSVLASVGGYHEGFRAWGFEDNELVARMRKLGHEPQHVPDWPFVHLSHPRRRGRGGWYAGNRVNKRLYGAMARLNRAGTEALVASGGLRVASCTPLPQWQDVDAGR